jgi:phosphoglycolate phosphatase-like HAD superfamily hydrolase
MIEAVILDWSGVVSDDWPATFATSNDVLEERGYKRLSEHEFKELYELPWIRFYEKQGIPVPKPEKERATWDRLFPKHYGKVKVFPEAKKVMEWLSQNGKKALVFSAHNQKLLDGEIKKYGLKEFINSAYGSVDDKRQKIDALVEAHEIERETTLFVGDMVHDVETAKQADIKSVAVLCGYDSEEKLENAKPDFILNDLGELPALIEKLEATE